MGPVCTQTAGTLTPEYVDELGVLVGAGVLERSRAVSLVTWSERLSVGYQPIDDQHRRLVEIINCLHDAMAEGKGHQALGQVLGGLVDYTQTHFASEEAMMQKHGYAGYAEQKLQHDALTRSVLELQSQFRAGQMALTMDVMKFLKTWLVDHIESSDKAAGAYIASRARPLGQDRAAATLGHHRARPWPILAAEPGKAGDASGRDISTRVAGLSDDLRSAAATKAGRTVMATTK